MNDLWVNVVAVLFFILVGAFFAAAELALVSLRESQIAKLADHGRRGRRLAALTQDPNRFLAAGQVGVTLAGFISAGFGAAQIAPVVTKTFVDWGMSTSIADPLAFVLVTLVIVFCSLVLGELVPKRIALQRVEAVALFVAGPIDVTAKIFRPFIFALSLATDAIVRLFGIDPKAAKEQISGEELRDLVATHDELTAHERELIDDVFQAGDRELREVMIPRTEVEFLAASTPIAEAARHVADQPHSRYPVMRESFDDIIGFVHIRDIFVSQDGREASTVGQLVRGVPAFPGTKAVLATLSEMRRHRQQLAIVVDEYGGTAGIVTLEDLVEELIGDIRDEYDIEQSDSRSPLSGNPVVDGLLNVTDFAEEYGIELPEGPYETLAGFVVATLGHLPSPGESVVSMGYAFIVEELDGRRLSRVRIEPLPEIIDQVLDSDESLPQ